jgi:hypothetical protein
MTLFERDELSALRSLKRFLAHVLPPPWDVQLVRREPQERPLAVVRFVGPTTTNGSAYVVDYSRQVEVFAYPIGVVGEPAASEFEARRVAQTLQKALRSGHAAAGSRALRVPFYDFSELEYDELLPVDAAPSDYLAIGGLTFDVRQDPEADDLYTVMLDFRAQWSADGDRSRFEGPTLTAVSLRYLGRSGLTGP